MAGLGCQGEAVRRECSNRVGGASDKGRIGEAEDGFKEESLKQKNHET